LGRELGFEPLDLGGVGLGAGGGETLLQEVVRVD
jgi:hypothetical protein